MLGRLYEQFYKGVFGEERWQDRQAWLNEERLAADERQQRFENWFERAWEGLFGEAPEPPGPSAPHFTPEDVAASQDSGSPHL